MKVIGFAGTAKNTGKTTTASKVLSTLRDIGSRVAITSIGYDGENIDNVTGLPKPLYYLKAGDIIATASQCLKTAKSHTYRLLEDTQIQTILGAIQIVEILENNTYTLAGPNRRTDLEQILKILSAHHADFTLVDGALNRIVPMICADGLVLSTGAAFDEDVQSIALHAAGISYLFQYKQVRNVERHKNIHLQLENGESISIRSSSLITQDSFDKIQSHLHKGIRRLTIPGACYPEMLSKLLVNMPAKNIPQELILGNPLYLIASGSPTIWKETLASYESHGFAIGYLETLPLLFITVNPFFPRFIQASHTYESAYVDAERLQAEIISYVPGIRVINVQEVNNQQLLSLLN